MMNIKDQLDMQAQYSAQAKAVKKPEPKAEKPTPKIKRQVKAQRRG